MTKMRRTNQPLQNVLSVGWTKKLKYSTLLSIVNTVVEW